MFAFIAYELIYFTSLASFRQRWYELFLGLHVFLQAAALALLWFHHSASRVYVGIALVIFLVDRLFYRLFLKTSTFTATTCILPDSQTLRLSIPVILKQPHLAGAFGRCVAHGWRPTDHVFVTVPSLAHKHILQAHPFTIASAAPSASDTETNLTLLIRAQDGFSADLLRAAQTHSSLRVRIDGPYGTSHARSMLQDADLAMVVAGGSGIAVAWPLLCFLLDVSRSSDTEIASTRMLRRQKIVFVWVVHEKSHLEWAEDGGLDRLRDAGVDVVVPGATKEKGRPDLRMVVRGKVLEWADEVGKRVGVVTSGPDGLGRGVNNACAELVGEGRSVGLVSEKFGW